MQYSEHPLTPRVLPNPFLGGDEYQDTCVKTRGQLEKVSSLLLPCRSWELNSDCQAWQEASLPAEPLTGPGSSFYHSYHSVCVGL